MTLKLTKQQIKDHRKALKVARKALAANSQREQAAGVEVETAEYLRLNRAVSDAEKALPFLRR